MSSLSPAVVGPRVPGLGCGDDERHPDRGGRLVGDHGDPGPGAGVGHVGRVVEP